MYAVLQRRQMNSSEPVFLRTGGAFSAERTPQTSTCTYGGGGVRIAVFPELCCMGTRPDVWNKRMVSNRGNFDSNGATPVVLTKLRVSRRLISELSWQGSMSMAIVGLG